MIEEPPYTKLYTHKLRQLVQQGLISKVSTDTYTLNPELFGADPRTRRANEA